MKDKKDKMVIEGNNMIIEVARDGTGYTIYKPWKGPAGALSDHFTIFPNPEDGKPVVYVNWHAGLPHPVVFELRSSEPITGVGFAGCYCVVGGKETIELYRRKGPCGGNFFLRTDLTKNGATTVEIENWGHQRTDGYILNLEFGHDTIFDPQIYNEGELPPPHEPPPHEWKKAGCLGLLVRLVSGRW